MNPGLPSWRMLPKSNCRKVTLDKSGAVQIPKNAIRMHTVSEGKLYHGGNQKDKYWYYIWLLEAGCQDCSKASP